MQGRNIDADVEDSSVDTVGEEEGEMTRESSIDICTPPCVKLIANGKMLYNTGSSASVMLCDDLDVWDRSQWEGGSRGEGGNTYT